MGRFSLRRENEKILVWSRKKALALVLTTSILLNQCNFNKIDLVPTTNRKSKSLYTGSHLGSLEKIAHVCCHDVVEKENNSCIFEIKVITHVPKRESS